MTTTQAPFKVIKFATYGDPVGTYGQKPVGRRASGNEVWVECRRDDTDLVVTSYRGWGPTGTARLSGEHNLAAARAMIQLMLESR